MNVLLVFFKVGLYLVVIIVMINCLKIFCFVISWFFVLLFNCVEFFVMVVELNFFFYSLEIVVLMVFFICFIDLDKVWLVFKFNVEIKYVLIKVNVWCLWWMSVLDVLMFGISGVERMFCINTM